MIITNISHTSSIMISATKSYINNFKPQRLFIQTPLYYYSGKTPKVAANSALQTAELAYSFFSLTPAKKSLF